MAEQKKKKAERGTLKKVLRYIKKYWFFVAASLAFAALTVAFTLYIPILTGRAIDQIVGPGEVAFDEIRAVLWTIVFVIALTAVSQWLMNLCNNRITYRVIRDIRRDAFAKIEILPLKYIDSHSYGEVVSRVIADVDQFADGLLMGFTFYRGNDHCGDPWLYAVGECEDHPGGGGDHAGLLICGKFYRQEDLFHVQASVGDKRGADGPH